MLQTSFKQVTNSELQRVTKLLRRETQLGGRPAKKNCR